MKARETVVVIGGGLGGLSAAIHAAAAGRRVVLLEQNEKLGGKCNHIAWNGFHFDTGPSLLTLPDVVRDLFASAGRRLEDYLQIEPVRPACRYFFADGLRFDAPGSIEGFRAAVADTFPHDVRGFDRFIKHARRLWEISGPMFLYNRMEPQTLLKMSPKRALAGLGALRPWSMRRAIKHFFRSPELRQLFMRYATYNGSDPWRTPATFNCIAYAEMAFGSWHCRGGMYALVRALERLARELGVEVRQESPAARCHFDARLRLESIRLASGEVIRTKRAIINQDAVTALCGTLLSEHPEQAHRSASWQKKEVSGSGYVMLLALDKSAPELAAHNVFFCENYRREFDQIFHDAQPLSDPTVYISVPSKIDASQAPEGKEGWFVLVNAPSLDRFKDWPDAYASHLRELLSNRVPSLYLDQILWEKKLPPTYLQTRYSAWQGSIYGPASNRRVDAFFRVPNRAGPPGIAFAGGSAHPGGGIPLVLLSGKMAAEVV